MSKNYGRHVAPARRQPPTNFSDLSVIILSAAPSKKMRSFGCRSLIPLKNNTTTLIEHQYTTLRSVYPNCEILLVCGEDWKKVREKCPADIRLIINPLADSSNVIYSAVLALVSILNRRVLLVYGDLLFDAEFIRNKDLDKSGLYLSEYCQYDPGLVYNNGKVENVGFGLPNKWAQVAYLTGKELEIAAQVIKAENTEKLLGHELLNMIIDGGGNFGVIENKDGKYLEIDSYKQFNTASEWN